MKPRKEIARGEPDEVPARRCLRLQHWYGYLTKTFEATDTRHFGMAALLAAHDMDADLGDTFRENLLTN